MDSEIWAVVLSTYATCVYIQEMFLYSVGKYLTDRVHRLLAAMMSTNDIALFIMP